jgi:hypothetical protein
MAGVWGLWRAREMARADITFLRTGKTGYWIKSHFLPYASKMSEFPRQICHR